MTRLRLRALLPLIASAFLSTACGTEATGECTGTHLGTRVNWPIDGESARVERFSSDRYGNSATWLFLAYLPEGSDGLIHFGADVALVGGVSIDSENGPKSVRLMNAQDTLSPEADTVVVRWEGTVGTPQGYGSGYPEASGVPLEGSVTLDVVDSDHAEGHFVYRYADGSELTCTFNVPTPAAAGGAFDDDDEDDDD